MTETFWVVRTYNKYGNLEDIDECGYENDAKAKAKSFQTELDTYPDGLKIRLFKVVEEVLDF